jgi:hypothetical protein
MGWGGLFRSILFWDELFVVHIATSFKFNHRLCTGMGPKNIPMYMSFLSFLIRYFPAVNGIEI